MLLHIVNVALVMLALWVKVQSNRALRPCWIDEVHSAVTRINNPGPDLSTPRKSSNLQSPAP